MTLAALGPADVYFLVFCRVGACLMFVPVYSSLHVTMRARLFLALAVSVSIAPLVSGGSHVVQPVESQQALLAITAECVTGAALGLTARLVYSAVQVAGNLMATSSGYNGSPDRDDGSGDLQPELGALISLCVLVTMVVLDFHVELIKVLIETFDVIPFGAAADPGQALDLLVGAATQSINLAVRLAAPLLIAGVLINFAFGLVNKMAPQIPVYFISGPFLLTGALWILERSSADLVGAASARILSQLAGR